MAFDWRPHKGGTGNFAKFETLGQQHAGRIMNIRTVTFDPEKGPVVLLDMLPMNENPDEQFTLALDKVDLRNKVAEFEPQIGDLLSARWVDEQRTPNGRMKLFDVRVKAESRQQPEYGNDAAPWEQPGYGEPDAHAETSDVPPEGLASYSEEPF